MLRLLAPRPLTARPFSSALRALQQPAFDPTLLDAASAVGARAGDPALHAASMLSPREDAFRSRLTGVRAGRTVSVFNGNTSQALQRQNMLLRSARIAQDRREQRFYLKPGKVKEQQRSRKHRREFMRAFKGLIEVVKDAKRKGY
ncbi:AGL284Cp [Eremothecium gossypii ATCC 10895]|uniref:AGL284Cp n=1 Tax=Eremothecium gossypii (strain ATCC 10895 / CBS 109.51 / FGSC 9923 / NRRL Y-1056) TaxID=284811 RepID=Q751J0_EREGS|nr:AGL284Cp [Eremothecium gossypii ATCC 10895]AAS54207.2 AGL284Cp [Eremothecium gossypii ATCC 10895]AEY98533.1 FAGL284Cp [Eremothecium gossypii FDAG1]